MKAGVAFVLALSLALPVSIATSCNQYTAPDGRVVTGIPAGADSSRYKPVEIRQYAWSNTDASGQVLVAACFLWPLPLLAYAVFGKRRMLKQVLWYTEPVFAVGSAWLVWSIANLGARPAVGAYRAIIGDAAYGALWLTELIRRAQPWRVEGT
jgi:hypothetical protein